MLPRGVLQPPLSRKRIRHGHLSVSGAVPTARPGCAGRSRARRQRGWRSAQTCVELGASAPVLTEGATALPRAGTLRLIGATSRLVLVLMTEMTSASDHVHVRTMPKGIGARPIPTVRVAPRVRAPYEDVEL